jgi:hypothetical protein
VIGGLWLLILAAAVWAAYNWGVQTERGRWEERSKKLERKSRDHRDLGGHIRF